MAIFLRRMSDKAIKRRLRSNHRDVCDKNIRYSLWENIKKMTRRWCKTKVCSEQSKKINVILFRDNVRKQYRDIISTALAREHHHYNITHTTYTVLHTLHYIHYIHYTTYTYTTLHYIHYTTYTLTSSLLPCQRNNHFSMGFVLSTWLTACAERVGLNCVWGYKCQALPWPSSW